MPEGTGSEDDQRSVAYPASYPAVDTADAVEHTVRANRSLNPWGSRNHPRHRGTPAGRPRGWLLTPGQVAVGERQPGQVARAQARADRRALEGVAACDGAAPMARARLAAAAKAVIVFQLGTFMFMSPVAFRVEIRRNGSPRVSLPRLWDGEKSLPDPGDCRVLPARNLSASGTRTLLAGHSRTPQRRVLHEAPRAGCSESPDP